MEVKILYEDNHLLGVEKPVNIPVQQDKSKDMDLLNILKQDIKIRYNKPGNVYLGLIHRLDRPVGGAMVFAKTSKGASRLSDVLRRKSFDRTYLVIVKGKVKKKDAFLEHYLFKDKRKNKVFAVSKDHKEAKKAVLEYKVITYKEGYSLLKVQLHTGRSHQIRVQLATIGHPIYGDQKYGENKNEKGKQIALWSHELKFKHPTKDEHIRIKSSVPEEFPWLLFHSYEKAFF